MTTQVQDDGFHEIQLNGKQLVFLFMAATVVSVVIFLCGVLVGRGVKTERTPPAQTDNGVLEAPAPPPSAAPAQTASSDLNSANPPPVPPEDLSYTKRLEENNKRETLKAPVPTQRAPATVQPQTAQTVQPRVEAPPAAVPTPKPVATAKSKESEVSPPPPAPAAASPSRGDGYAIQVAALRESGEADTIAKRLVNKGYDAYVLTPPGGTPNVYRVRVGSFKTRRDAEVIASKLQQEEQFKPWITR